MKLFSAFTSSLVHVIMVVFAITAMATYEWLTRSSNGVDTNFGLFEVEVDGKTSEHNSDTAAYVGGRSAFALVFVGFLLAFASTVMMAWRGIFGKDALAPNKLAGLLTFLAGILWLMALVVYSAELHFTKLRNELDYGFSFGFVGVIAAISIPLGFVTIVTGDNLISR